MDPGRIREAKQNYDLFLLEGLLKPTAFEHNIFHNFEQNALESLQVAQHLFTTKTSFLWTVVSSYYAMFYIASAYLYKKGYKAQHLRVHQVVLDALIILAKDDLHTFSLKEYEEEKDAALSIAESLLDDYANERTKRSRFQYEMGEELKSSRAKTSLERAKRFVEVFRLLLS